jgi:hypothetical protein
VADQPGIDFTAFRTSPRSAVTAALSADLPATFRASVKAELVPATASGAAVAGSNPLAVVAFDGSGFMELRGVKQGSYVLKLSCPTGTAGPTCEPWETVVQVGSTQSHNAMSVQPSSRHVVQLLVTVDSSDTVQPFVCEPWETPVQVGNAHKAMVQP